MNLNNLPGGKKADLVSTLEVDTYPARVVQVIYLGKFYKEFKGVKSEYPINKAWITYELDCLMEDKEGNVLKDKPHWLSEGLWLYSLKSERALSTERSKALDPTGQLAGGDIFKWINLPCQVSTETFKKKDGTIGFNIKTVLSPSKRNPSPELINPPFVFNADSYTEEEFNRLYPFLQKMVNNRVINEVEPSKAEEYDTSVEDDEIPF